MANRYRGDLNYDYQDHRARHIRYGYRGRSMTNLATIRLLRAGTESIIEHNQQYNENQRDQFAPAGSSHFPDEREQNVGPSSFIGVFPFLCKLFCFGLLVAFLGGLSFGEYSLLYSAIMPPLHSNNLLYFDYTNTGIANHLIAQIPSHISGATGTSTAKEVLNTTTYDEESKHNVDSCSKDTNTFQKSTSGFPGHISPLHPLKNDEIEKNYQVLLQSAPFAVVDLFSNHNSWQHYHPDVIPEAKDEKHILKTGVPHYIEIILDLPESKTNLEKIGIFSIVVDLHSTTSGISDEKSCNYTNSNSSVGSSKLLASSTRTATMPHESFWITVVRKTICIIPHVLGAIPESRRVIVPSFRFFVESEELPLRYITVRLLVSPQKARRGDMVEVVQGILRISEELTGIQLVLKEWFFTCMLIGTILLFFLQLVFVFAIRFAFLTWCRQEREDERDIFEDVSEGLNLDGLNDVDGDVHHGDDHSSDRNTRDQSFDEFDSERESSHDQQRSNSNVENVQDEQGEWEDLIPLNGGVESQVRQNEDFDGNIETAAVNPEPNHSPLQTTQSVVTSHHLIPDN